MANTRQEPIKLPGHCWPTHQVRSLRASKPERGLNIINKQRHENIAGQTMISLIAHPARSNRIARPGDNDALGIIERVFNFFVESWAHNKISIPPDSPSFRFQDTHKRSDTITIFRVVRDKNINHSNLPLPE